MWSSECLLYELMEHVCIPQLQFYFFSISVHFLRATDYWAQLWIMYHTAQQYYQFTLHQELNLSAALASESEIKWNNMFNFLLWFVKCLSSCTIILTGNDRQRTHPALVSGLGTIHSHDLLHDCVVFAYWGNMPMDVIIILHGCCCELVPH